MVCSQADAALSPDAKPHAALVWDVEKLVEQTGRAAARSLQAGQRLDRTGLPRLQAAMEPPAPALPSPVRPPLLPPPTVAPAVPVTAAAAPQAAEADRFKAAYGAALEARMVRRSGMASWPYIALSTMCLNTLTFMFTVHLCAHVATCLAMHLSALAHAKVYMSWALTLRPCASMCTQSAPAASMIQDHPPADTEPTSPASQLLPQLSLEPPAPHVAVAGRRFGAGVQQTSPTDSKPAGRWQPKERTKQADGKWAF